ncbi:MAG: hypothetical protein BWX79_03110 [Alphaproteobacteria bacterium ADurb.Bin100]|nr:MAG: hypothetical protein BWX79_03110 [Alphaproteobacteria bacterium ADurb.Bin100]
MNSFFSSALSWSQGLSIWLGQGPSWVSLGITPSFFWFAKICSRSFS